MTPPDREFRMLLAEIRSYCARAVSGDLSVFGGPRLEEEVAGRVRAEQFNGVSRNTPWILLAMLFAAAVLVVSLWPSDQRVMVVAWTLFMTIPSSLLLVRSLQARRRPKRESVSGRAVRVTVINAAVFGALWALVPILFFEHAPVDAKLVVATLCAGMMCAGAFALGSMPAAAIIFADLILGGSAVVLIHASEPIYALFAALLFIFACSTVKNAIDQAKLGAERVLAQWNADRQRDIMGSMAEAEIRRLALYDSLTDLPNRAWFGKRVAQAAEELAQGGAPFAIICLDLDHFKSVNDTQGHPTGDALLVEAAKRLTACVGEDGAVARLGGDEFGIIYTRSVSVEALSELARSINASLSQEILIDGANVTTGVSIGIAVAPTDGTDINILMKFADLALYRAKADGRGGFRFFEPGMDAKAKERRALEMELRAALGNGEFTLVFQPLVDVVGGLIKSCEALLRWNHPTRGLLLPLDFIPLAEETGLIHAIGEWALREACQQAASWPNSIGIAVNLSAVQFHGPGLVAAVQKALADSGLDPKRLELEVTETVLIAEMDRALSVLSALREMGVRIALDDFGTGYSSLSYLRKLPFDKIKIDRSFVRDLSTHVESQAIVSALIGLAGELGVGITAEGVETPEQLASLRASGCAEAQGYLISRPQSAAGIAAFIAQSQSRYRSAAA
jgi:diguanylate cyclase (GGDEF)-like protein